MNPAALRGSRLALLMAGSVLAGCATSQRTLNVALATAKNPNNGPSTKIARVVDQRTFQVWSTDDPKAHSTRGSRVVENGNWRREAEEAITSRLVARKQNHEGVLMGEVLLPEGVTVAKLVETTLVNGLREGGYRVLLAGDPGFENAVSLDVAIDRFWIWPSHKYVKFESRIVITRSGGLLDDGEEFHTYVRSKGGGSLTWSNFQEALNKGLVDLRSKIRERIPTP